MSIIAQFSDYFLLAGLALGAISVVYAVVQLVKMQPPRAAVITLILGIVLLFAGALTAPHDFSLQDIRGAWGRVSGHTTDVSAPTLEGADKQVTP